MAPPPLSTLERGGLEKTRLLLLFFFPFHGRKKYLFFFFLVKEGKRVGGNKMCLCCPRPFSGCGGGGGGGGGFFTLTIFAQIIPGENPRVFALPVCFGGFFGGKFVLPISRNFPNRIHAYIFPDLFCKGVKKEKERKTRKEKEKGEKKNHLTEMYKKRKSRQMMPGNKNVGNHCVWRERELLLLRGKKKPDFRFSQKKFTKRVDCHNKKDNKKNEWNALLFPVFLSS